MKQWIDKERTILVTELSSGMMLVAIRSDSDAAWGPPIEVEKKR